MREITFSIRSTILTICIPTTFRDEAFVAFRTSAYKLHLYETITGYKFILLSDPLADSLKFVLRQIYTGPFVHHVVRNPLVEMDSREIGVDNDEVGVWRGPGVSRVMLRES